jgi:hypothetical protein
MYAEILGQLQDITWLNSKSRSYTSLNQLANFHEAWQESHATRLDSVSVYCKIPSIQSRLQMYA